MVVLICFSTGVCENIYEETPYKSKYECELDAANVKDYMMQTFPNSAGEIHCLNEEEFRLYNEWLKQGGEPRLSPQTGSSTSI